MKATANPFIILSPWRFLFVAFASHQGLLTARATRNSIAINIFGATEENIF